MGILNVTPDSFSDTIRYTGKDAVSRIFEMEDEGADIIDIGGESTRPGAEPVEPGKEKLRILNIIREAAPSLKVPISVDTMHPETAEEAVYAGAGMINDVSGMTDIRMAEVAVSAGVPIVAVHMHGTPATMRDDVMKGDVISQISRFFDELYTKAADAGIRKEMLIVDPGIGFGKTFAQNIEIINALRTFKKGSPLLVGTSMKSFLELAYPNVPRNEASILSAVECVKNGADIVRVHDIKGTVRALK
jgi:dihydropteroate synthase